MNKEQIKQNQPIFYKTVENQISKNKINHAYLIEGYDALSYAMFLYKSILCNDVLACDTCNTCRLVDEHKYIDFHFLDGSNTSIKKGDIEALQKEISKQSVEGRGIVYIIHMIENSTVDALNSLLKVLEEPLNQVYAIFTTNSSTQILPTILSRCQIMKLRPLNKKGLKNELLKKNVSEEKANVLVDICASLEEMLELYSDELFNNLYVEALNFIEDDYYKRENLMINVQTNLVKNYADRKQIDLFLSILACMYKDILNIQQGIDSKMVDHPNFMRYQDRFENIIRKIELILDIQTDLRYNANVPLLIDRLVYNM